MTTDMTPELSPKPAHRYTRSELVYAWLMIAAGYGFCRMVPLTSAPLGGLLWFLALLTVTCVFLLRDGKRPGSAAWCVFAAAAVTALTLFFSANPVLGTVSFLFCLTAYAVFVSFACGNIINGGFSDLLPVEAIKAVLILPLSALGRLFSALGTGKGMKKGGGIAAKIILGASLAVVPTAVVFLLLSYDGGFLDALEAVFDLHLDDVFSHIGSLILGIPVAMLLFGLYYAAREKACADLMTEDSCRKASERIKVLSPVTAVSAVLPILFLYAVFFFSQWDYYMSAFRGVLPGEEELYSAYAREGFFQLCAVSAINAVILITATAFTKRTEQGKTHIAVRILNVVLALSSLVLLATAVSKLFLYIRYYGLTPKRVYAAWFDLLLTLVFVLILAKQFFPKMKVVALSVICTVVLFAALGMANADARIADYNVSRYLDGSLSSVDVIMLEELGDAGVPALVRLTQADKDSMFDVGGWKYVSRDELEKRLLSMYKVRYQTLPEDGIFAVTLPYLQAKRALESILNIQ